MMANGDSAAGHDVLLRKSRKRVRRRSHSDHIAWALPKRFLGSGSDEQDRSGRPADQLLGHAPKKPALDAAALVGRQHDQIPLMDGVEKLACRGAGPQLARRCDILVAQFLDLFRQIRLGQRDIRGMGLGIRVRRDDSRLDRSSHGVEVDDPYQVDGKTHDVGQCDGHRECLLG